MYWTNRYPVRALLPMMAMVSLARNYPPSVSPFPVYVLFSDFDRTVDPMCIRSFYRELRTKKTSLLINNPEAASKHVLAGDVMAPQNNATVTQSVIEFLETLESTEKSTR